jgi:hypothetical protein
MLVDAHERFASQGWGALVRAPIDGIPYKVYATEAGPIAGCYVVNVAGAGIRTKAMTRVALLRIPLGQARTATDGDAVRRR